MNGVLLVDKPDGMTSFDVVRKVRRWSGVRRVGHAGTLDPLATGVLPVAIGWATRLVEYLMEGDKTYRATLKLGEVTDSQDVEGNVIETHDWSKVERTMLEEAAQEFVGMTEQLPPMHSALKQDGKPLYLLARQGIEVERKRRQVRIESLVVEDFSPPFATFTVHCSKGTYVRTLCHDLGRKLGCGAHMTALRRLTCGRFDETQCHDVVSLQAMVEQGRPLPLVSPAEALADWPELQVDGPVLKRLKDGVAPNLEAMHGVEAVAGERIRFTAGGQLVAIARFTPGVSGKSGRDFELIKVFPTDGTGA